MPKITIYESDNTGSTYNGDEINVFVPGNCTLAGAKPELSLKVKVEEKNSKKYTQNIKVPMSSFRRRRINQSIDHDSIIEKFYKKYNLRINYPVLNSNLNSSNKKKRVMTYEKKDQKQLI